MNSCISACKSIPVKRVAAFLGMFLFCAVMTFAQSKGAGGFQKAITEVSSYQTPVSNLMKAIRSVELPDPCEQPDEGHRCRHCTGRCVQYLLQDAER